MSKMHGENLIEINNFKKSTGKLKFPEFLNFLCFSIINEKSDPAKDENLEWKIFGWKLKKMHRISIFKARFIDDSSSLTFSDFSVSCLCLLLVNSRRHSVWKSPKMSHFWFFHQNGPFLAFLMNFCPLKM